MKYRSISCIFPIYNESEEIERAVLSASSILERLTEDYEIIVVNDGSSDNSLEISQKLARNNPRIKIINHPLRLGFARTLKSGFKAAEKEFVFYTDGDNQFDFREIDRLLPLMDYADIVSAFRVRRADPVSRIFFSRVYNLLLRLCFGFRLRDANASFKLYRQEIFKKIKIVSKTFLVDAEILIKAQKAGYIVKQVGVSHYPRRSGLSCFSLKSGLHTLLEIIRLWRKLR